MPRRVYRAGVISAENVVSDTPTTNVNIVVGAAPATGSTLIYNAAAERFEDGSLTLDTLSNVDTTGATTGDLLTWDGTEWVASAFSELTLTLPVYADAAAARADGLAVGQLYLITGDDAVRCLQAVDFY